MVYTINTSLLQKSADIVVSLISGVRSDAGDPMLFYLLILNISISAGDAMKKLGINGFGRIGKATLRYFLIEKCFDEIFINLAPEEFSEILDITSGLENDPDYHLLSNQTRTKYSFKNHSLSIESIPKQENAFSINKTIVRFLKTSGNPREIGWAEHGVDTVVETTGKFLDPTLPANSSKGSIRGHIDCGAKKVVLADPFQLEPRCQMQKGSMAPDDWVTMVTGINESKYFAQRHRFISAASSTTAFLAHMLNPLFIFIGPKNILSASVTRVCSFSETDKELHMPVGNAPKKIRANKISDFLGFSRLDIFSALKQIMPEIEKIGLIVESIDVPTPAGALIILVVNCQKGSYKKPITNDFINDIYRQASIDDKRGYLRCDDFIDVSNNTPEIPKAILSIQTQQTHTRTAEICIDIRDELKTEMDEFNIICNSIRTPVIQVVIYGWADHETWNYTKTVADNVRLVNESLSA